MKRIACLLALTPLLAFGAQPKMLFDGKDLAGWTHVGPGELVVEDGLIKTKGGMGLLYYSKQKLSNCVLKVVFKTNGPTDNSGVYIRMPDVPTDPWYGVHNGYEVQIDGGGDDWHSTGAIYSISKVTDRKQKSGGEWNTMEIELRGPVTIVKVNGEKVNEYHEGQPVPERKRWFEPVRGPRADSGYIGLQNHDGKSNVWFKEVSISPLP